MIYLKVYSKGKYDNSGGTKFGVEAVPSAGDYMFLGPDKVGYVVKAIFWVEGSADPHVILEAATDKLPAWAVRA